MWHHRAADTQNVKVSSLFIMLVTACAGQSPEGPCRVYTEPVLTGIWSSRAARVPRLQRLNPRPVAGLEDVSAYVAFWWPVHITIYHMDAEVLLLFICLSNYLSIQ